VKAKAVKLVYGQTLPFTALIKQLIASYGSVTALPLIIKTRSLLPSLRVHFSDSQVRASIPLIDSKVIYYNYGRLKHYTNAYINL